MYAVCLDIGGTFIKYGIISKKGDILYSSKERTSKNGSEALIKQITKIIENLLNMDKALEIKGIGISSAGQIDYKTGTVAFATDTLPGWTGVQVGKIISDKFNMPCFVENDVNAAALGELHYGEAKKYKNFICITIGTGIGGAIVLDGKLYHGHNCLAGEVGHMIIDINGKKCSCKNKGCFEQYGSVSALINQATDKLPQEYYNQNMGAEWLFEKYEENPGIREIIDNYLLNVSLGIVNLIHILNPEAILIGGGISESKKLLTTVEKHIKNLAMESFVKGIKILATSLKNNSSMYGVAAYVHGEEK